jgi:hypothetical protein
MNSKPTDKPYEIAALREDFAKAKDKFAEYGETYQSLLLGYLIVLIDDRERFLKDNVRIVEEVLPAVLAMEESWAQNRDFLREEDYDRTTSNILKSIITGKED